MSVKTKSRQRSMSRKERKRRNEIRRRANRTLPESLQDEMTVPGDWDDYFNPSARVRETFSTTRYTCRSGSVRTVDGRFAEQSEDASEKIRVESPDTDPQTYLAYTEEGRKKFTEGVTGKKVSKTFRKFVDGLLYVVFENPQTGSTAEYGVTENHPFYVLGKGWVAVGKMEIGDSCVTKQGFPVILKSRRYQAGRVEVFNIEVEDCHTYFVGAPGSDFSLWVHNKCDPEQITAPEKEIFGNFLGQKDNYAAKVPGGLFTSVIVNIRGTAYENCNDAIDKIVAKIPGLSVDMDYHGKIIAGGSLAGQHAIYGSKPDSPEYVGAKGMQPCIAVVIFSPSTGLRAAFHFSQSDAAAATLYRYNWPADSRAIIAGAYNGNYTTKGQLAEILAFMKRTGMKIDGFISGEFASQVYVDRKGNWIVVPDPKYANFVNGPPPTLLSIQK